MESSDTTTTHYHSMSSPTSTSSSPPPVPTCLLPRNPPATIVLSPCAACKILRRRCADNCMLAPYFPPTEPVKFTTAHRVFGASNIIKLLQDLPESQRADAVSSMVYEAEARLRDPVYGCAGAVCQLQKQVNELKVQLARAQAELVNSQAQYANLVALICVEMAQCQQQQQQCSPQAMTNGPVAWAAHASQAEDFLLHDSSQGSTVWEETLWT